MGNVKIRPMRPEDAADCHEVRTRPNVRWGTLQLPTLSLEDVKAQAMATPTDHKLVAEVDGKVVGMIGLHGVVQGRQRHAAGLGMSIHDDYQGRGLGKQLMNAILDLADNWLMLERVHLSVYPDNPRAIQLYRSTGFVEEGIARKGALRDGTFVDMIYMARLRGRAAEAGGQIVLPAPRQPLAGALQPPAGLTVRGVLPQDAPALHRLQLHPAVLPGLQRVPSFQEDEYRKELSALPRTHHVLVAELGGTPVGFAYLAQYPGRRAHVGSLRAVAVHPDCQGRGIGAALTDAALDLGRNWLGLRRIEAEVPATAASALALLERRGFAHEVTQRAALIQAGGFTDLLLLARLEGL